MPPVAMIIVLLVTAVLILVIKKNAFAKGLTMLALAVGFILSVAMVAETSNGGAYTIALGRAPWNLSLSAGRLEAFMACLFTGIGFLVTWASCTMIAHDVAEKKIPLYYTLLCMLIAALCGIVFFDNLVNVLIFIGLSSFSAAGIVILKNQPESIRAGMKHLTLSILGILLLLAGIVILYSVSGGALTMRAIHEGLLHQHIHGANTILYALIFITIGVSFLSALFPMHIWLPDAHATAPSPSSAMLSSLVVKAYIVFFIKILYTAVGYDVIHQDESLWSLLNVILVLGVIAMLAGSLMALLQTDIKRMIAYSSVAQVGYIFMGIGLGNELGLYAAVFHILAHAVTKAGLCLVAGSIIEQTHNRKLDKMGGVGMQMPVTMALFAVGALSMTGIPLLIGFNSKWNFAAGIMDAQKFWVIAALAVSSLLNALYYLPVAIHAFFGHEAREKAQNRQSLERPLGALLPIIILACFVVLIAVWNGPFTAFIQAGVASIW